VTDGWIDRQLRRVREDYDSLPSWQKTAKSNDSGTSRVEKPSDRSERDQSQQPRQETKAPAR